MGVAPVISYNYGKQDKRQLKNVFSICMRYIGYRDEAIGRLYGRCRSTINSRRKCLSSKTAFYCVTIQKKLLIS